MVIFNSIEIFSKMNDYYRDNLHPHIYIHGLLTPVLVNYIQIVRILIWLQSLDTESLPSTHA